MTGRAAAVRNRLLVAAGAVLLAWLFGWTDDAGLLMLLVAVVALALAVMRGMFGGLPVLLHWLFRYRAVDIGLRQLGDIIGEHEDDMRRAGLVVPQGMRRPSLLMSMARRRPHHPRPAPDLVPRLRHAPDDGGIVISLEAVRAGMSQEEILRALPRLRSAWGVDVVEATARPGGRVVDFRIPMTEHALREAEGGGLEPRSPRVLRAEEVERRVDARDRAALDRAETDVPERAHRAQNSAARPPDAPPVTVVGGRAPRTETINRSRPPRIQPQLEPDERGRYELTMLPEDAARTFAPRSTTDDDGPNPSTDEIPVIEAPTNLPTRATAHRPTSPRTDLNGGGDRRNPTDVDERSLRLGAHWRTGKER
ncbi:hypothetical protein [Pseudactinotalea suaedae]|uniref:hypothetical protein n=1 Tax=Pseudactinotalea suaedae TaxID=1524924 RepID=UPI0012E2C4C4|nr:hypothetical protein [Pseudactinotalea suaedae]